MLAVLHATLLAAASCGVPECGLPLVAAEATCPECGATVDASADHCGACGHASGEPGLTLRLSASRSAPRSNPPQTMRGRHRASPHTHDLDCRV